MSLDFFEFVDDFFGDALATPWDENQTGSPTGVAMVDGAGCGAVTLTLANTNEAESDNIDFGDKLAFDLDNALQFRCRLQVKQTMDSTSEAFWGLTSDNAASDTVAVGAFFKVDGSNALVVETDDATNNNDDVATGITLTANTYYDFLIDLTDLSDVKFYVGQVTAGSSPPPLKRVAAGTTFDMSDQSNAFLQPNIRIDKAQDTNTDALEVDYVRVTGRRLNS